MGKEKLPTKLKANESLDDLFYRSKRIQNGSDYKEMLHFLTKFTLYKPYNNFLVFMQRPGCQLYATSRDWKKKFKRTPKLDASPLIILAPMHPVLFVYDLEDTEGEPVPQLLTNPYQVQGAYQSVFSQHLRSHFNALNIQLQARSFNGAMAGSIIRENNGVQFTMTLNKAHPEAVQFATIIHELAHLFLGHLGSKAQEKYPARDDQLLANKSCLETEAESVSYLVLSRLELDGQAEEYLAFYNLDSNTLQQISFDLILKTAAKIEEMVHSPFKIVNK